MSQINKYENIINLTNSVITDDTNSKILMSFIKYLVLHYNIIPFRYENFKYYSDNFKKIINKKDDENDDDDWNMAMVNKQRELVINTSETINNLMIEIQEEFKQNDINEIAIFFGSTVLTPNEIYLIRFPNKSKFHLSKNHSFSDTCILKCLSKFIDIHSHNHNHSNHSKVIRKSKNMFLLYKMLNDKCDYDNDLLYKNQDINEVLKHCNQKYLVIIENNSDNLHVDLNCCKELIVFEDMDNLNLSNDINKTNNDSKKTEKNDFEYDWFQSKHVAKRYECKKVKGKLIWEYLT